MSILIDLPGKDGWCHLVGSTRIELHEFAQQIGIKRCWFHVGRNKPHYDIRGGSEMERKAKAFGANLASFRDVMLMAKSCS